MAWTAQRHPRLAEHWLLPVVGETWDGYLNDINGRHVTVQAGIDAPPSLDSSARAEPFDLLRFVPWGRMDPFYAAVVQATEEAVANALAAGQDMTGRDGRWVPGLPAARVAELVKASAMRRPTTAELETD